MLTQAYRPVYSKILFTFVMYSKERIALSIKEGGIFFNLKGDQMFQIV